MRPRSYRPLWSTSALLAAALLAGAPAAHAQQPRRFAARLSLGAGLPLVGLVRDAPSSVALGGSLAFEYRPLAPLAFELSLADGLFPMSVPAGSNLPGFASDLSASLGVKLYPVGNFYVAARGGAHDFLRELRGGGDAEIGWDIAVTPAFSLGPFARGTLLVGSAERPAEAYVVLGITLALGAPAPLRAPAEPAPAPASVVPAARVAPAPRVEDADRDGVADDVDRCPDTAEGAPVDPATGCAPARANPRGRHHHRAPHHPHHGQH